MDGYKELKLLYYDAPCGRMLLGALDNYLCLCDWAHKEYDLSMLERKVSVKILWQDSEVLSQARCQLDEYFAGERRDFDLPLRFVGTDFQKRVWQALQRIPYGETISYAEQARRIGQARAVRAVANANGANLLSVVVPCHRVVGSNGTLTGYGGGLEVKQFLLALEALGRF